MTWSSVRTAAAAAFITCTLFSLVALREVSRADGNYSVLLRVSPRAFDNNPMMRQRPAVRESLVLIPGGYDAQFTYFAAFDPLMTRYAHAPDNYSLMMDAAPYRFSRIGHVWLTRLLSGGRWRAFPAAMVWGVLLGVFVSALWLGLMAAHAGRSPWWGLAIAAVPGFWQSVQLALPEPLAIGATLIGVFCWTRGRWVCAAVAFAAALLTRETSVVAVACIGVATFRAGQPWRAVALMATAAGPILLWKWHIGQVLFRVWGWDAYFFDPGTIDMPFAGMLHAWSRIQAGQYYPAAPELARAAVGFAALVTAAALASWLALWKRPTVFTAIAALYGLIAISLAGENVWPHPGNVQRTSAELFVWLAVVAATWPAPSPAVRRVAAAGLTAAAVFLLALAHDASTIRAAFLP